jgi:hypothetical protein
MKVSSNEIAVVFNLATHYCLHAKRHRRLNLCSREDQNNMPEIEPNLIQNGKHSQFWKNNFSEYAKLI